MNSICFAVKKTKKSTEIQKKLQISPVDRILASLQAPYVRTRPDFLYSSPCERVGGPAAFSPHNTDSGPGGRHFPDLVLQGGI